MGTLGAVQIAGGTVNGRDGHAGLGEAAGGEHALAADVHPVFFAKRARFFF